MSDPSTLDALLDRLTSALAEQLAPRLAAELATTREQPPSGSRLLSLDELIERLPKAKAPSTWKRWLYERTRRGQIPGCHKLGGRLFFDPDQLETWLNQAENSRPDRAGNSTG